MISCEKMSGILWNSRHHQELTASSFPSQLPQPSPTKDPTKSPIVAPTPPVSDTSLFFDQEVVVRLLLISFIFIFTRQLLESNHFQPTPPPTKSPVTAPTTVSSFIVCFEDTLCSIFHIQA